MADDLVERVAKALHADEFHLTCQADAEDAWQRLVAGGGIGDVEDYRSGARAALAAIGPELAELNDQVMRVQTGGEYQLGHDHGSAAAAQYIDRCRMSETILRRLVVGNQLWPVPRPGDKWVLLTRGPGGHGIEAAECTAIEADFVRRLDEPEAWPDEWADTNGANQ